MSEPKPLSETTSAPETDRASLQDLQAALYRVLTTLIIPADARSPLLRLPLLQVKCLYAISQQEGCSMRETAATLGIDLPGLSRVVDRLEERALAERRTDPHNRRVVRLHLTDSARALLAEVWSARLAHLQACTQHLNAETLLQIRDALRTLVDTDATTAEAPPASGEAPLDPFADLFARYPRTRRSPGRPTPAPTETSDDDLTG